MTVRCEEIRPLVGKMLSFTRVTFPGIVLGLLMLNLAGCAVTPPAPSAIPLRAAGPRFLRPLPNTALVLETTGTVGPRPARTALDRGFGEYDSELQSSLYLCSVTGPAAGPCLAVLGSLFALAGATSSWVYSTAQGAQGRAATAATHTTFAKLPAIAGLSTRIAGSAAAQAAADGRQIVVSLDACATDFSEGGGFTLDIVQLKLDFTPGYQFQLTLVARVTEVRCGTQATLRTQRLAYLSPTLTLSKNAAQAAEILNQALQNAVVALGPEVDLYLQGQRPPITP